MKKPAVLSSEEYEARVRLDLKSKRPRFSYLLPKKPAKKPPRVKKKRPPKNHGEREFTVINSETYQQYLASKWWRKRRQVAIEFAKRKCERCGGRRELQVHHKSYKRLWKELADDLEVLCRGCHEVEHRAQQYGLPVDDIHELDTAREIGSFL